jgi:hypothetical protein
MEHTWRSQQPRSAAQVVLALHSPLATYGFLRNLYGCRMVLDAGWMPDAGRTALKRANRQLQSLANSTASEWRFTSNAVLLLQKPWGVASTFGLCLAARRTVSYLDVMLC